MLIIVGEQMIGPNRIFRGCFGVGRFEPDKRRDGDEGAKRAVEAAGGAVALLVFGAAALLVFLTVALLVFLTVARPVLMAGGFPGLPVAALIGDTGTGVLFCDRADIGQGHRAEEQDGKRNK